MDIDDIKKWARDHVGWEVVWKNSNATQYGSGKVVGYDTSRVIIDGYIYRPTDTSVLEWLDESADRGASVYAWLLPHMMVSATPPKAGIKSPPEKCRRCGGPAMALFTTVECSTNCGGGR